MRKIIYSKVLINLIAGCIFDGLTDEETSLLSGVPVRQISRLRAGDDCPEIRRSSVERMRKYIALIRDGDDRSNRWQRIAWFLERRYPDRWAKPEVLLNLNASSTTNNVLVITAEQASSLKGRANAVEAELSSIKPRATREANIIDAASIDSPIASTEGEPSQPTTRTPGSEGLKTTPSLPRKSQISKVSSNSKVIKPKGGKLNDKFRKGESQR